MLDIYKLALVYIVSTEDVIIKLLLKVDLLEGPHVTTSPMIPDQGSHRHVKTSAR